jgi:acetoin utilization deacetylase AcuC-like enzyme
MMLFTHKSMIDHDVPEGHAERGARLRAVLDGLTPLNLKIREAPYAERSQLARVHSSEYIDLMDIAFERANDAIIQLDPDTFVGPHSREAIYRASGACIAAVDAVMAGEDAHAFCAVRPPGHHAEPKTPMGFCVFNNVAVAAMHALVAHGLKRVAIIDFDVHHGNGTQTVAEKTSASSLPRPINRRSIQAPVMPTRPG